MPRRNWVGRIVALGTLWLLGMTPSFAEDAKPQIEVEVVSPGSSVSATRKKALADLPLDKLAADARPQADEIIKNVSLFRRMPTLKFVSEPEVYNFFLAHPDVAVSVWRVMDISTFEMWQTGPTDFEADSHDGSTGTIEVLHASAERQIVVCEGSFKSPLLFKPIKARALLHLQPTFHKRADGQTEVTHTLDMFVSFPSQPIDITAKLISPVSHAMADRNFREVSLWVAMMNVAMVQQPEWIEKVAGKMDGVPEIRRGQLLKLALSANIANRRRELQRQAGGREVSLDEVMAVLRQAAQDGAAAKAAPKEGAIPASAEQSPGSARVEPASAKR
ncbi:MAG: hypothetical protein ACKV2Q_26390 [Planctomycetaceae bacterium]